MKFVNLRIGSVQTFCFVGVILGLGLFGRYSGTLDGGAHKSFWTTGYWFSPSEYGNLPVSGIEYSGLTHIAHVAVYPNSDGTLEPKFLKCVRDYARDLIATSHRHGVKVLLCVSQSSSGDAFKQATKASNLDRFVSNVMGVVEGYGYDGVDLDWETNVSPEQFLALVRSLRVRLNTRSPKGQLTGAFWESTWYLAKAQNAFDQINVMAYDNCSPTEGFSWHNAALYNAGDDKRRTVDWRVRQFFSRIPSQRLGLGLPFYSYIWRGGAGTTTGGITGPGQTWTTAPSMESRDYRFLVTDSKLWRNVYKRRDYKAGNVPYLSLDLTGAANDSFVTYEDESSIIEKVRYATSRGLGGLMIWELSADYLPGQTPSHPLLQAVRAALHGTTPSK